MKLLTALACAAAFAFTASTASAAIVCNDEGDCWRVKERRDYDPGLKLRVYNDDWHWKEGEKYRGKHYDAFFEWSDERIYCSELVWKIYKTVTGLELGALKPLASYDLSSDIVKQTMAQRYGNKIPLQEKMIAPSAIFESDLLKEVYSN